ncbi:MAG: hypothetical protein IJX98_07410 [Clostridia bacterium]|nr:hypothetical protein [Clostridia bacterium]
MTKKYTKKEIREMAQKIIERANMETWREFDIAKEDMEIAENALVNSLDETQRALYDEFCEKRKFFYFIAEQIYINRF